MSNKPIIMGSSLHVLSPYFGLTRLEMQCPHGRAELGRLYRDYQFSGDNGLCEAAGIWEALEPGGTQTLRIYRMRDVKPVLRGFDDLLTPLLQDGKMPLYEYVRFMWPKELEMRHVAYGNYIEVHGATSALYLMERKDFEAGSLHRLGSIYLQTHGYAVGLTPEQFIRK